MKNYGMIEDLISKRYQFTLTFYIFNPVSTIIPERMGVRSVCVLWNLPSLS